MEREKSKPDPIDFKESQTGPVAQEQGMRGLSLSRNPSSRVRLMVFVLRASHILIAFTFLVLALVEFVLSPPYFDALTDKEPIPLKQNVSASPEGVRRVMDLPIVLLFIVYFIVIVWRKGWGAWSVLMTAFIFLTLLVFLTINYWCEQYFPWKYFTSRGVGIILQVFSLAASWAAVVIAVQLKINRLTFTFSNQRRAPEKLWSRMVLIGWNLLATMFILFFCLLIWFSRIYYSWACVNSVDDVLLMCQFTSFVQCYECHVEDFCSVPEQCISNSNVSFHCLSPLFLFKEQFHSGVCLFNYNIGFFTFILVFASVGGMYVFLSTLLNFITRSAVMLSDSLFSFVRHETRTHIDRFTYSLKVRKSEARSLIRDHSSHATDSSSDSDSDHVTVQSGRLLSAAHPPTNPEHKD